MARKKLTIHREGYYRKPYKRKDGTWVKGAKIPASTYKIADVGAPGKGKELFDMKPDMLVGYKVLDPATTRRKAIMRNINLEMKRTGHNRNEAELTVFRRLTALSILFKRTHPKYSSTIKSDTKWLKKKAGKMEMYSR